VKELATLTNLKTLALYDTKAPKAEVGKPQKA
jgi:hypothetical protein